MNKTNVFVKAQINYFDGVRIPCPVNGLEKTGWGLVISNFEKLDWINNESVSVEDFVKGYSQADFVGRTQASNYMLFDDEGFKNFYDSNLFEDFLNNDFKVKKQYSDFFVKHFVELADFAFEEGKNYKTSQTMLFVLSEDEYAKFCYLIKMNNGVLYRPVF